MGQFSTGHTGLRLGFSAYLALESKRRKIRRTAVSLWHMRDLGHRSADSRAHRSSLGHFSCRNGATQAFEPADVSDRIAGGGTERDLRPARYFHAAAADSQLSCAGAEGHFGIFAAISGQF